MKRSHDYKGYPFAVDEEDETSEIDVTEYDEPFNVPNQENEVTIETTPSPEVEEEINVDGDVDDYDVDCEYPGPSYSNYFEDPYLDPIPKVQVLIPIQPTNIDKLRKDMGSQSIDVIELGRTVICGQVEKAMDSEKIIEKATRSACFAMETLGDISLTSLVAGLNDKSTVETRFAMIGESLSWNMLKSNLRHANTDLTNKATQQIDVRLTGIDLNYLNIQDKKKLFIIRKQSDFVQADLGYIFSLLTFRPGATLLNKTKQFAKAYFLVACDPRCAVWKFTLRRGNISQKKTIVDLPDVIRKSLTDFLLETTGIGDGTLHYNLLDRDTPFAKGLGELEHDRVERYHHMCHLKDTIIAFFRDAITDCLNEIREMPFCMDTCSLVSPLRGKPVPSSYVTWKNYEQLLKDEIDNPTPETKAKRVSFENTLRCTSLNKRRRQNEQLV